MPGQISNAASPKEDLYMLKGKTMLFKDASSANNTVTIHEVTAGKTFYLMSAGFAFKATSGAATAYLLTGESGDTHALLGSKADITAIYKTEHSSEITIAYPLPIPIPSGVKGFLKIQTAVAGSVAFAWIVGWEE